MKQISLKKRYIGTGPNQIEPKDILSAKKSFWKKFDQVQIRKDYDLTILGYHNEKYKDAKYKLDQNSSKQKLKCIQSEMKLFKRGIDCIKYNSQIDEETQNQGSYPARVCLSDDFNELEIWIKKPVPNEEYILEPDHVRVEE